MPDTTSILVVDDEPDLASLVRMKFRRQIRRGEFDFTFAADGMEALEALEANPDIDIVLTDINMPRMDGLTLLARIAEWDRLLKAVVVSAYGDMENIRTAMNRGAFDFLTKPIELDDLEITINKSKVTVDQQKRALYVREMFGRYVSDEVAATLLANPDGVKLGGEKREVTMLMSDLRGFSAISERVPPETVVELLNTYLSRMAEVITRYNGTINEFIGDAIFVIFGAPIQREDAADRAVACALAMQLAMQDVNAEMDRLGLPHLEMGIGVNTGEVVVGNIGSLRRVKYGVVGSHVNLTGRIESYTVGRQVLISEHTRAAVQAEVQVGRAMQVAAKGFSDPIQIYEVEAIGEPFDLAMPVSEDHLEPLPEPIPLTFTVLDGKHTTGTPQPGTFTRLSTTGATLRTDYALRLLDNLKISLPTPDAPEEVFGDLYAKVTDTDEHGCCTIRFTAIPEDMAAAVHQFGA